MDQKLKKKLTTVAKFLVTGVALYFVFVKVPFDKVWDVIKEVNLVYFILALLFFVISKWVAAYRLNRLFYTIGISIRTVTNIKLYLLGMFYNLFLPGGIGGDAYKMLVLKKRFEVANKKIVMALLVDRLSGLLALSVLCAVLYLFVPTLFFIHPIIGIVLAVIVLIVFYVVLKKIFPEVVKLCPYLLQQSFLVQIAQLICGMFILVSFDLLVEQYWSYLFLFLVSSVVSVLPFTIGGLGARELTFVYGSPLLGVDIELALALSLLFYVITAFTSFFGLFFSFKPLKELA